MSVLIRSTRDSAMLSQSFDRSIKLTEDYRVGDVVRPGPRMADRVNFPYVHNLLGDPPWTIYLVDLPWVFVRDSEGKCKRGISLSASWLEKDHFLSAIAED